MSRYPLAVAGLLALVGCQSTPAPVVVPEVVKVVVREYVPVPEELTRPCAVAELEDRTVESVVEAANARKVSLEQCNEQLRRIRELADD